MLRLHKNISAKALPSNGPSPPKFPTQQFLIHQACDSVPKPDRTSLSTVRRGASYLGWLPVRPPERELVACVSQQLLVSFLLVAVALFGCVVSNPSFGSVKVMLTAT